MRKWSDQEILDALVAWNKKHGSPPLWLDWKQATNDHPASQTVRAHFGSWNTAVRAAGLEPRTPNHLKSSALRLRAEGLTNSAIAKRLNVHHRKIKEVIGPSPPRERSPRTAEERRAARIAALRKALQAKGEHQ